MPVGAAGALLVALGPGDRVELAGIGLELGVRGVGVGLGLGPRGVVGRDRRRPGPPAGSSLGEYRMWRTLTASSGRSAVSCAQVDLADLTLRAGLRGIRDDLVLELLADRVAAHDGAVLGEVDAVVDDACRCTASLTVSGVDLGHAADPEDAVLAFDDGRRRVDLGGEERVG